MTRTQAQNAARQYPERTVLASFRNRSGNRIYKGANDQLDALHWLQSRKHHATPGFNMIEALTQE